MAANPHAPQTREMVAALVRRARAAQRIYDGWTQDEVDEVVTACGWAIMEPGRNRLLAVLAVADTGLGSVEDKFAKNHRKTLGLLRDLKGAKSVGVIAEDPAKGVIEIARPVGIVAAITPSTNPAATPANKIINALKGRNAIILAPSPKGYKTGAKLVEFMHAALTRVGAPRDLLQILPAPVSKEATLELMRQADLVAATGSQANIRAAYSSGTPAVGVGMGNVATIVDATADLADAAAKIARSKTFDHATSCSSENSAILLDAVYDGALAALTAAGGVMLTSAEKAKLQRTMWPDGKLSADVTAQAAPRIAALAGLGRAAIGDAHFLMVEETGFGPAHPFSGEKLSPVLAVYRARDFAHACEIVASIYTYQGAGHSVGIHTREDAQALHLGLNLPVSRVIVNQAHCIATGGSFDNGLDFSLSMGCGTWGRNGFSGNMNYRHFLNITRIARPIPERVPGEEEIFGAYFARHGR
ncbi:MAG TPA: aldehyde dehydrogenase family protein [Burkholderiales bacterium]|nr:aldehyde dehydrogenase family protein [Burkholderiales bacterium]